MQEYVEKEKRKGNAKKVFAAIFAALFVLGGGAAVVITGFVSGGFVNINMVVVTQHGVAALSIVGQNILSTSIDLGNTTDQMTTLIVTLIGVMIPLMVIMWYFGLFSDLFGMLGGFFKKGFKRE